MANCANWLDGFAQSAPACILCTEDLRFPTRPAVGWCDCGVCVCRPCFVSGVSMTSVAINARRRPSNLSGDAPIITIGPAGEKLIRCPSCSREILANRVDGLVRMNTGLNAMTEQIEQLKAVIHADKLIADATAAAMSVMSAESEQLKNQLAVCESSLMIANRSLSAIRGIVEVTPTQPASPVVEEYDTSLDPPSSPSVDGDFSAEYDAIIRAEVASLMERYATNEDMRLVYYNVFDKYPEPEQGRYDMARDIAAEKEFNQAAGCVHRHESGRAERMRKRRAVQRGPRSSSAMTRM